MVPTWIAKLTVGLLTFRNFVQLVVVYPCLSISSFMSLSISYFWPPPMFALLAYISLPFSCVNIFVKFLELDMTPFDRIKKLARVHGLSFIEVNDKAGLGTRTIYHCKKTSTKIRQSDCSSKVSSYLC